MLLTVNPAKNYGFNHKIGLLASPYPVLKIRYDTRIAFNTFPTVPYTESYKLKSRFQRSEIELYHKTYRYDLKMFILHVKCNFDENFKDLLSYSNIFDKGFFSDVPQPPAIFQPKWYTTGSSPFQL